RRCPPKSRPRTPSAGRRSGGICSSRACYCSRLKWQFRIPCREKSGSYSPAQVYSCLREKIDMPDGFRGADRRHELVEVIHRVRNRWRLKLALRGAVIVVAGTLLALMSSAAGLEALKFTAGSITVFRVLALIIFGGLVYVGLVKPMRRRVTDSQVALYLEECDPSLQTAILSAVEGA